MQLWSTEQFLKNRALAIARLQLARNRPRGLLSEATLSAKRAEATRHTFRAAIVNRAALQWIVPLSGVAGVASALAAWASAGNSPAITTGYAILSSLLLLVTAYGAILRRRADMVLELEREERANAVTERQDEL